MVTSTVLRYVQDSISCSRKQVNFLDENKTTSLSLPSFTVWTSSGSPRTTVSTPQTLRSMWFISSECDRPSVSRVGVKFNPNSLTIGRAKHGLSRSRETQLNRGVLFNVLFFVTGSSFEMLV